MKDIVKSNSAVNCHNVLVSVMCFESDGVHIFDKEYQAKWANLDWSTSSCALRMLASHDSEIFNVK